MPMPPEMKPPMPGEPPMGASGPKGGMMPPEPKGPEGMTPESVAADVTAALPEPDKGYYSEKSVAQVADAATEAMKAVIPASMLPPGFTEIPAPKGEGGKIMGKLPASLMVPVMVLIDLAVSAGGDRYAVDLATLTDDGELRMLVAKLKEMAKDRKLIKALAGEGAEEAEEKPEAKGPPMKGEPPENVRASL